MKKLSVLFLSLALILVVSACGSGQSQKSGNDLYSKVKKSGTITIGTEGTYPPFTYRDKSNKLTGFDIDIATEAAKRVGLKPKFIETKWAGMLAGLDDKRYDMVANEVGIEPDRQKKYDFSDPYIVSRSVIIVKKGSHTGIKNFKDLKGKKVAQSLGSNFRKIAEDNGANVTTVDGFDGAINLLTSGRIDATINDSLSYLTMKKTRPDLPIETVYEQKDASKSAFLFRKGSGKLVDKFNQALKDMKKDGTYLKISKKWFGTDVSK